MFSSLDAGLRRPLNLELSDTKVYGPYTRAHLGLLGGHCPVQSTVAALSAFIKVQRFRGGLVFKAHRLFVNHSTLGLRVIKKKKSALLKGEGRLLTVAWAVWGRWWRFQARIVAHNGRC